MCNEEHVSVQAHVKSVVISPTGLKYTGSALNPARVIGPAFVFLCTPQRSFWLYLLGEVLGGILAAGMSAGTYGVGGAYQGRYQGAPKPIDNCNPLYAGDE